MFCACGRGSRSRTPVGGKDFRSGYEGRERVGMILRRIFFGDEERARLSVA